MTKWREEARTRRFQLWDLCVTHARLLIRSPIEEEGGERPSRNLDLIVHGLEYVELPQILNGIEFVAPSREEIARVRAAIGDRLDFDNEVRVIASEGKRFLVVAWQFQELESRKSGGIFWGPDGNPILDYAPPGGRNDVGPRFGRREPDTPNRPLDPP